MGDPAGISPELAAKLTVLDDITARCRLLVIGDLRVFSDGARVAGIAPDVTAVNREDDLRHHRGDVLFMDLGTLDPAQVTRGVASLAGGQFALANYKIALELARERKVA